PFHHIIFESESWAFSPLISSMSPVMIGGVTIPEVSQGLGDVLTADERARLPFAIHRTNPINHAEALWDPGLQQQVLGVLAAIRPSTSSVASYGRIFKMSHVLTANTLHSHPFNYGHAGTSGQQQVTAYSGYDDNDLWRVLGPVGQPRSGQLVQNGDTLRLEHVLTGRMLHSHPGFPSPVTGQQEVTCFNNNSVGDSNDNWRIEIEGGGAWEIGKRVRLIHSNTNAALHSHAGFSHPQWTMGQQEVTGFAGRDDNDWWSLFEIR
ncbi:MAG TPA: MIR domain-containing protein, partial [Blastocatellia bacterium]|nr:MIR domain-containing protein [Blastocatellia bacterium]